MGVVNHVSDVVVVPLEVPVVAAPLAVPVVAAPLAVPVVAAPLVVPVVAAPLVVPLLAVPLLELPAVPLDVPEASPADEPLKPGLGEVADEQAVRAKNTAQTEEFVG